MVSQGADIAVLGNLARALAEAETLPEIKTLRDKAEAVRAYAKAANMGLDLQNRAAEFKLRAERKAGVLLARLSLRGGDRRSTQAGQRLSLDDIGISRGQSRRWQLVASISDTEFDRFLSEKRVNAEEITLAAALRLARLYRRPRGVAEVQSQRFGEELRAVPCPLGPLGIVVELQNHHKLLRQILEPIASGGSTPIPMPQLRLTHRLLWESADLLKQLEKELSILNLDAACS